LKDYQILLQLIKGNGVSTQNMSFACTVYSKQQVTLACLSNVEKWKHTLIADSLLEDSFFYDWLNYLLISEDSISYSVVLFVWSILLIWCYVLFTGWWLYSQTFSNGAPEGMARLRSPVGNRRPCFLFFPPQWRISQGHHRRPWQIVTPEGEREVILAMALYVVWLLNLGLWVATSAEPCNRISY
jgi:hypothetical protein